MVFFDDEIRLVSCDVSPKNVDRGIGGSGFFAGNSVTTVCKDESISQDTLASLLKGVRADSPCVTIVLPSGENWVFYVAHDGASRTKVMLHLVAEKGVAINGELHTDPFHLPPGAHGFRVTSQGAPVVVDHEFIPLE